jgi:hypothetical protein
MTSPFDFINEITHGKKDLMDTEDESVAKSYNAYIVNRGLSFYPDTILFANEMNQRPDIPKDVQFHYLLNTVRKRKRFSKWLKQEKDSDLDIVKEYYGYSNEKAKEVLSILTPLQISELKKRMYKGGQGNNI